MIKGSIYQLDIIILIVYASNNRNSKCMKKKTYRTEKRNRQIQNYS